MLFTVFQYVPILEEEIHSSKTMSKKSDDTSTGNDADDDSDPDDDRDSDEFFNMEDYNLITLYASLHEFHNSSTYIFNSPANILTPPPRI